MLVKYGMLTRYMYYKLLHIKGVDNMFLFCVGVIVGVFLGFFISALLRANDN